MVEADEDVADEEPADEDELDDPAPGADPAAGPAGEAAKGRRQCPGRGGSRPGGQASGP